MSIKSKLHELTGLPVELLPNGYQVIGDILILNLKPEAPAKRIALAVHELIPSVKTIMQKINGISGEFRIPSLKKLWGDGVITRHREHGCVFEMNVTKVMWAKGNLSERKRIADCVNDDENVLDMFAGIGYFTIPIAVHNPSVKIISIEKNPVAFSFLKKNVSLNKLSNVKVINGDSMIESLNYLNWADRIIMGYIPEPINFLSSAFKSLKDEGIIHYEGVRQVGDEDSLFTPVKVEGLKQGYECELLHTQVVKSYGPKRNHVVVDVKCKRSQHQGGYLKGSLPLEV